MQKKEHEFIPYEAVRSIGHGRVLVFAPHPDDEVFGCGGAIITHVRQHDPVKVIIVTDGAFTESQETQLPDYAAIRRDESCQAGLVLGYGTPEFLGYPDRGLVNNEDLISHLCSIIVGLGPDVIYLPSSAEIHPDHRALFAAGTEACRRSGQKCLVAYYEVAQPLKPDKLLDITSLAELKEKAVGCFASQLKNQDYKHHILGLNAFRTYTLPAEVRFAEAYQCVRRNWNSPCKDHLFIQPTEGECVDFGSSDGSNRPHVTIIVRTMNRPELPEAMDSIARQTYHNIDVVLVDALGTNSIDINVSCGRYPVRVVSKNRPLLRQFAANAGLDAVKGDFFCFLDEDDLIFPEHIEGLVNLLIAAPGPAVYSWIEKECEDASLNYGFNKDYCFFRLLQENYIPVHALLFRRTVLDAGCRFDESLELFEDWDFLIQVAHLGPFQVLKQVTGIYRNLNTSGIHDEADFARKYKVMIWDKWRKRLDAESYAEFMEWTYSSPLIIRIPEDPVIHERDYAEILRLKVMLNGIVGSNSWKVTAPIRRLSELIAQRRRS